MPKADIVLGSLATGVTHILPYCKNLMTYEETLTPEIISLGQKETKKQCQKIETIEIKEKIDRIFSKTKYDYYDIHLYSWVKIWPNIIKSFKKIYGDNLIVSEFGGPNLFFEEYSDEYQAQRLKQYLTTLDESNIKEAYYFKLFQSDSANPEHRESGLFKVQDKKIIQKPAYSVFKQQTVKKQQ